MPDYLPRLVDDALDAAMAAFPAVLLVGPRAGGKTTSAKRVVDTVVRLDEPQDANRYRLSADESLRGESPPVLLDEWHLVPEVLGAVKHAVDEDPAPGRFLITGSVQAERSLPAWPLTGRARRLRMYGLTERELRRRVDRPGFLSRLRTGGIDALDGRPDKMALGDYVTAALSGTAPYPRLHMPTDRHRDWYAGYVDQVVYRDLADLEPERDPGRVRRFLQAYALNTAGVTPLRTLYESAGIDQRTATVYERLLSELFLVEDLPAYGGNRLKRLVRMPKRCLVEPGLLAPLTGLDRSSVLASPDLLGRLLETFVIAQLRPEVAVTDEATLCHLREERGRREVDVVVEFGDQRVIALEVKATTTPSEADARHLRFLRDALGQRFAAGIVLHAGRGITRLDDRIVAAPIAALWSG